MQEEALYKQLLDKRVRTLKQIVQDNLEKSTLGQDSYKIIEGRNPLSINLKVEIRQQESKPSQCIELSDEPILESQIHYTSLDCSQIRMAFN